MNALKITRAVEKLPELATELDAISQLIHRKAQFLLPSDRTMIQARLLATMMAVREVENAIIPEQSDALTVHLTAVVAGKGSEQEVLECVAETYRRALYDIELALSALVTKGQTAEETAEDHVAVSPDEDLEDEEYLRDLEAEEDDDLDDMEDDGFEWSSVDDEEDDMEAEAAPVAEQPVAETPAGKQ